MNRAQPYRNLWLLTWLMISGLAVVGVRLVYIQAINPQEPAPFSSNDTEIRRSRPALRGEIRDANDTVLVQSQLAVTVRADPARLGSLTPDVAKWAALHLDIPEVDVLARLQPVYQPRTQFVRVTNGLQILTNREVVMRLQRANVLATNVPPMIWDHLYAAMQTNRFAVQSRLIEQRSNVVARAEAAMLATPWWDLATRWKISRERGRGLRAVARQVRLIRTNLLECRASGLFPEYVELRKYPRDHLAAHVLGFTTNQMERAVSDPGLPVGLAGAQGIEQRFDSALQGRDGVLQGQVVGGREYVPRRERDVPSEDGLTVLLTLDVQIQEAVERALDEAVERLNPMAISAVVVRPDTGDILALANRPTFNPNDRKSQLTRGLTNPLSAFKNRAINEPFEPGSTFKLVTYSAALNEQLTSASEIIDCHGGHWTVPGTRRTIHDDQGHIMNRVTVEEAFAKSSNVGAVQLGLRISTNRFLQYIRDFGFLSRTDIDCGEHDSVLRWTPQVVRPGVTNWVTNLVARFGEASGVIPSWDGWTPSSLPFGYGLRATPLQTVMAAAAIASGGVLRKPRLVRALKTADGRLVKEFPVQPGRAAISPETADKMVSLMEAVVIHGSGANAAIEGFDVAGKTGTAKKFVAGGYTSAHYHASFVGFFPARKPVAAIIVTVDEPQTAGKSYYGSKAAAPVFRQIALDIVNVMKLTPTLSATNTTAMTSEVLFPAQVARQP